MHRSFGLRAFAVGTALLCASAGISPASADTPVQVCANDKQSVASGNYVIGAGKWNHSVPSTVIQCITGSGGADFRVSVSQMTPPPDGPGAYPFISPDRAAFGLPISLSNLGDSTSSWSTAQIAGDSDVWDTAYDLWFSSSPGPCDPTTDAELMIWLNGHGQQATPFGARRGSANVGGTDYTVNAGIVNENNPDLRKHNLISYQLPTATSKVDHLDLRLFAQDAVARGWVPSTSYLCDVSAGFELWQGGTGLATNSFSFQPVTGLPTGTVAAGIADRCLDDSHSGTTDGNPVGLWTCNGTNAQTWTWGNDGTVRVLGKCLAPVGGRTAPNTRITIATCDNSPAQQWRTGPSHALVNVNSTLCLDDPDSSSTPGVQLQLYACNQTGAQQWRLPYNGTPVNGGLTNAAAQKCLTGPADGSATSLLSCTYNGSQIWTLSNDGTLRALGRCLQPTAAGTASGTPLSLATCDGSEAQQWVVHPTGYLSHRQSGRCLDDPSGSQAEGVLLQLWDCNGSAPQTWYLPA